MSYSNFKRRPPYKKPYKKKYKRPARKYQPRNMEKRITKLEHSEELKYIDYQDTSAFTTTGVLLNYNQIAQGDDFNQRVGEEVVFKYINLKYRISKTTASAASQGHRFILFWDMQTNGVGPIQFTSTSLTTGLLDNSTITDPLLVPHNYRTKDRYHILFDKVVIHQPSSTSTLEMTITKKNIKLGGAKIKYSSSSSAVTALASRSLWLMFLGNASAVTDSTPGIVCRVWYTDA